MLGLLSRQSSLPGPFWLQSWVVWQQCSYGQIWKELLQAWSKANSELYCPVKVWAGLGTFRLNAGLK